MNNVVEVDETYVGGEEKNKHESKKTKGTQGHSLKTKKPVVGMVERDGHLIAKVVDNTKMKTIQNLITENVTEGATVVTDEYQSYDKVSKKYDHKVVHHSAKEFVNGMAHTNTIEGFWSLFKRGINGIYLSTCKPM